MNNEKLIISQKYFYIFAGTVKSERVFLGFCPPFKKRSFTPGANNPRNKKILILQTFPSKNRKNE